MIAESFDSELVWVTKHAQERLEEDYPGVSDRSARGILHHSLELDAGAVLPIIGRRTAPPSGESRYFLPPERQGLLVVVAGDRLNKLPWTLVTYLRLEAAQQAVVDKLWPKDGAPVTTLPAPAPPTQPLSQSMDVVRIAMDGSGWMTAAAIIKASGLSAGVVNRALRRLVGAGDIEASGSTAPNYRLKESD